MPSVDWSLNLTNLLLAVLTVMVVPVGRMIVKGAWSLIATIRELEGTLRSLQQVVGTVEPPSGMLGDISGLKRETRRHRDWLIASGAAHPNDRS